MPALSADARLEYYIEIGNGLPPPVNPSDERHELRFNTAVAVFEALRPGTPMKGAWRCRSCCQARMPPRSCARPASTGTILRSCAAAAPRRPA